jgi:hypothetical protein
MTFFILLFLDFSFLDSNHDYLDPDHYSPTHDAGLSFGKPALTYWPQFIVSTILSLFFAA